MGKESDHWQFPNFNDASDASAHTEAKPITNTTVFPTYADPCAFFQMNSAFIPPAHPTGFASGQKRFMVFDRTGDQTNLTYISFGSQFPHPCQTTNDLPASNETNAPNGHADSEDLNEEMHEDTEEIDALLYSDPDNDYEEEDEASTGHHSPFETTTRNCNYNEEDVASSVVLPPPPHAKMRRINSEFDPSMPHAKRRRINSEFDPSLADTASSTHRIGSNEVKKAKIGKIQEIVGFLRVIIPGAKGKDDGGMLDEAISYLKSLRVKANGLGVTDIK